MVQSSGRCKTAHTGCYLSTKAYGEACDELPSASSGPELVEGSRVVHRFETALYRTLFRGQSKKKTSPCSVPWVVLRIALIIRKWAGAVPFQRAKVLRKLKIQRYIIVTIQSKMVNCQRSELWKPNGSSLLVSGVKETCW
jgi:hypothetical protein